jgi:predicted alpha/beta superfamily hydrolase
MIEQWPVYIEPLHRETMLHIYLPDDYAQSDERYPVMYMFDGHNLFDDEMATFGSSWKLADFLAEYDKKFMIVGIECDHYKDNRLQEYTPYALKETFFGPTEGKGAVLMEWMVNTLKPIIDERYRTWSHREATGIGGSSMGGLMSFYGLLAYNNVFSKAACLSPTLFIAKDELINEFHQHFIHPDTRCYFSFGTKEFRSKSHRERVEKMLEEFVEEIELRKGIAEVNLIKGGKHSETYWEKESKTWFDFLWK